MGIKTAIVLAAGLGRKVWPYGEFRQKCTIPVANTPIVRWVVENLIEVGCERIVVVVGHYAQQVRGVLADIPNVTFVTQHPVDGTASAVLGALAHIEDEEPYLVVYGDIVTTPDNFRNVIKDFCLHNVEAATLLQPLGNEDASDWLCGGIEREKTEGKSVTRLTGIEGHPRGGSYRLCGVYAFGPTATPYLLRNPGIVTRVPVGGMPPPESEIAQSMQLMVDDGKEVLAVETEDFLVDVDKPWHVLEANNRLDYLSKQVTENQIAAGAKISDAAEINGHVVLGKNSVIGPRVVVNGTLIAGANNNITNGAILHGNIFVGDQCRISDYCDVGSSAVGNRCIIGHGAEMAGGPV